ncbi:hypothetical protein [Planktothrix mougeotii]|uniref:Uncharacterized protein n=1 Tax=Planktothrix mougeotii LEGE 06226 TaxID=1828728 RepID=A0ABR9UEM1_9CYAN|nr:hypothetical protein [Planktothrix mougeotii]MBE9144908.1 hypothetical protein [Planktothrix mougeotii LEGE 06226]
MINILLPILASFGQKKSINFRFITRLGGDENDPCAKNLAPFSNLSDIPTCLPDTSRLDHGSFIIHILAQSPKSTRGMWGMAIATLTQASEGGEG